MPWLLTPLIVTLMIALQNILSKVITLTNTSPETALCYPPLQLSLHFLPFFQLLLMLQFLLPLSLAQGLREYVYGELDHPLSTVISGPWTAVSGGSVRQRVDHG